MAKLEQTQEVMPEKSNFSNLDSTNYIHTKNIKFRYQFLSSFIFFLNQPKNNKNHKNKFPKIFLMFQFFICNIFLKRNKLPYIV